MSQIYRGVNNYTPFHLSADPRRAIPYLSEAVMSINNILHVAMTIWIIASELGRTQRSWQKFSARQSGVNTALWRTSELSSAHNLSIQNRKKSSTSLSRHSNLSISLEPSSSLLVPRCIYFTLAMDNVRALTR